MEGFMEGRVQQSVTPSGVEHLRLGCGAAKKGRVQQSVTPSGVEHSDDRRYNPRKAGCNSQ